MVSCQNSFFFFFFLSLLGFWLDELVLVLAMRFSISLFWWNGCFSDVYLLLLLLHKLGFQINLSCADCASLSLPLKGRGISRGKKWIWISVTIRCFRVDLTWISSVVGFDSVFFLLVDILWSYYQFVKRH